jgi:hypothetical protein
MYACCYVCLGLILVSQYAGETPPASFASTLIVADYKWLEAGIHHRALFSLWCTGGDLFHLNLTHAPLLPDCEISESQFGCGGSIFYSIELNSMTDAPIFFVALLR